ncbi:MAG: hypothetical protein WC390_10280 [Sulfurimonas sp.]|jgi:hypothetical protein
MTRYLTYYSDALGQWQLGYNNSWAYIKYSLGNVGIGVDYKTGEEQFYDFDFEESIKNSDGQWAEINEPLASFLMSIGPLRGDVAVETFNRFMKTKQPAPNIVDISIDVDWEVSAKRRRDDIFRDMSE